MARGVRGVEFPYGCIASKIWDAFFGFFGPFGPFGPFLHIVYDVICSILSHVLSVIRAQTDQLDQTDRKKIEKVPIFCLLLIRRATTNQALFCNPLKKKPTAVPGFFDFFLFYTEIDNFYQWVVNNSPEQKHILHVTLYALYVIMPIV